MLHLGHPRVQRVDARTLVFHLGRHVSGLPVLRDGQPAQADPHARRQRQRFPLFALVGVLLLKHQYSQGKNGRNRARVYISVGEARMFFERMVGRCRADGCSQAGQDPSRHRNRAN